MIEKKRLVPQVIMKAIRSSGLFHDLNGIIKPETKDFLPESLYRIL
jgi:hypothetical protein